MNKRAVVALAIGIAPNLPGFINAATAKSIFPAFFDSMYLYAWFIGLPLAAVAYIILMGKRAQPADIEETQPDSAGEDS